MNYLIVCLHSFGDSMSGLTEPLFQRRLAFAVMVSRSGARSVTVVTVLRAVL